MGSNINLTARPGCFQYQATLTVLARRVNRVLYLAFIIRGLMSSAGDARGRKITAYALSDFIQDRRARTFAAANPLADGGRNRFAFSQGREKCGGLGLIVTEFISVEGLTRGNLRSHEMMRFKPEERPIAIRFSATTR